MTKETIAQKVGNAANAVYEYLLPKSANTYAKDLAKSAAYATNDLTLSNVVPVLKLIGSAAKALWAGGKVLYAKLSRPKSPFKAQKQAEKKYLKASYAQLEAAKEQAYSASSEILTNTWNGAYHAGTGLLNGACVTAIGAIEASKYILPPTAKLAQDTLVAGLQKATEAYNQLPSAAQVQNSVMNYASYYLKSYEACKKLNSEHAIELVALPRVAAFTI